MDDKDQYTIDRIMKAVEVRGLVRKSLHDDFPKLDYRIVDKVFDSAISVSNRDRSSYDAAKYAIEHDGNHKDIVGAWTSTYTLNTLNGYIITKRGIKKVEDER